MHAQLLVTRIQDTGHVLVPERSEGAAKPVITTQKIA